MPHEVGQPREQQVRLVAEVAAEPAAVRRLDGLQPPPVLERLAGRQDADREQEAVPPIALEGGGGEPAHRAAGASAIASTFTVSWPAGE